MIKFPLQVTPPFDPHALFSRLSFTGNRPSLIAADTERQRLIRTVRVGPKALPLIIDFGGTVDAPLASLSIPEEATPNERDQLLEIASHMVSADIDLSQMYNHFADNDRLHSLFARLRGSKLFLDPDPFECLVRTIICQQLNLSFAGTLIERLARLAGEEYVIDNRSMLAFPTAEAIATLSVEQLRKVSFSQRKAEYVIDAARLVVDGGIDFAKLAAMPDEEAIAQLIRYRGIGRWTAECLLIFGFGRPDLLPSADIGLRNGLRKMYGLSTQPSASEVEAFGKSWSPWRTYITFYLWESLRL
ncbi:DNA-3-methyladenine glycosylase family protein [Paenibacillus alkalitolerans]|uniref:DNA-3-methyladenine glycosylase family protein n=1 Tax=Paenibacillus alkalitolerans TaxID=2799335 RepID=UPI0018F54370|nr:DNA-3-methyladenine glycosylase [Paenibacillus alkalitolerans]